MVGFLKESIWSVESYGAQRVQIELSESVPDHSTISPNQAADRRGNAIRRCSGGLLQALAEKKPLKGEQGPA
jgi:hypothetical protein